MRPPRVLVVDDEGAIRDIVRRYLEADGFEVAEAAGGDDALARFASFEPDLVVLDLMMPGMDGLEVLRSLRARSDVYVILLTAKADEVDKLVGLSVGADDYLTKPFSPRELAARVRAVLRRRRDAARPGVDREILGFDDLVIDTARREVRRGGHDVDLTALEFDLLAALAESPGRVYSRRQLLERVWGWDYVGDERVVDVHVRNLRRALGDDAADPSVIGTVRGVGYKFVAAPA
ncbi:MAG TPA: response regulator transcription factor [Acidimicrobiales bacterium]|nr:response regulator transcription factor [Acidimicrobiales bacterium]